mgnify:CR=1 FL=1
MQAFFENPSLTHLSPGGEVQMVDVSAKPVTQRTAIARGQIGMKPETLTAIEAGNAPKGDVVTLSLIHI